MTAVQLAMTRLQEVIHADDIVCPVHDRVVPQCRVQQSGWKEMFPCPQPQLQLACSKQHHARVLCAEQDGAALGTNEHVRITCTCT